MFIKYKLLNGTLLQLVGVDLVTFPLGLTNKRAHESISLNRCKRAKPGKGALGFNLNNRKTSDSVMLMHVI